MNPHMANDGFDKALSSNVTDNIFVSKKQFVKHNEYSYNACETICDYVFDNPNNNIEYDQISYNNIKSEIAPELNTNNNISENINKKVASSALEAKMEIEIDPR